jgi:hypothetical protein
LRLAQQSRDVASSAGCRRGIGEKSQQGAVDESRLLLRQPVTGLRQVLDTQVADEVVQVVGQLFAKRRVPFPPQQQDRDLGRDG